MKKLLTSIALIACLVLPLSAMAMTTIADNELSTVTGQSGVSIGGDVNINSLTFATVAWGDADGVGGAGGWVGLKDGAISNLRIFLRQDLLLINQLLTIDVFTAAGDTAVRIGLPTADITMASFDAKVGTWTDVAGKPGVFQEKGSIYVGGFELKMAAAPGYIDIGQDTKSGVKITASNVNVESITMNSLTWGDNDGLAVTGNPVYNGITPTADAGYVGLANLNIKNLVVNGTVKINVATAHATLLSAVAGAPNAALGLSTVGNLPATTNLLTSANAATRGAAFVDLATWAAGLSPADVAILGGTLLSDQTWLCDNLLATFYARGLSGQSYIILALAGTITVGEISATAALGSEKTLNGGAPASLDTLGKIFVSNLALTIGNNPLGQTSWVAITSH